MPGKTLPILAGLTAIAVALTVTSARYGDVSDAIANRGTPLLPGFADASKSIAKLTVTGTDGTTTLVRHGDRMVDASGFPIKDALAQGLTTNLAVLRIEEKKTADADRYDDLNLADPDAEAGAGTRVTASTSEGRTVADVVLGAREVSVGGLRGGQYVRRFDDPQSYLVRGFVAVPPDRAGWFDTTLTDIKRDRIATVTAPDFKLARAADGLALKTALPDSGEVDPNKINRVAGMVSPLTFIDVRKATGTETADGPNITFTTTDGVKLELHTFKTTDDEEGAWATLTASATGDAKDARALAERITKTTAGFDFKIGTGDYNTLVLKPADFAKKEPKS
ncbi:MAG: DUF4340 domain-containing protein [Pseudomonadota bacterium]